MARKNATVTDAKANAEKVSKDATVAAEAPKKNDAKRKRTEETPQDSAATKAPATKRPRIELRDQIARNYANSVHISLLAAETTKEELAKHFSDAGSIVHTLIFKKRPFMGKPGFVSGQVEFTSHAAVAKAVKKDQSVLNGATIAVKVAAAPTPAEPHVVLRALGLEPSVNKEDVASALAKWSDKIETIKVPFEGGENRGVAIIRCTDVATATDIFTNFKTPIKGSALVFNYARENPQREAHNAKLRAKQAFKKELKAKQREKEIAASKRQKEQAKAAHKKAQEKVQRLAKIEKEKAQAIKAKAAKAAQKIKDDQAAKIQKIKDDAKAKLAKVTAKA